MAKVEHIKIISTNLSAVKKNALKCKFQTFKSIKKYCSIYKVIISDDKSSFQLPIRC